jgi:hypothetical protein
LDRHLLLASTLIPSLQVRLFFQTMKETEMRNSLKVMSAATALMFCGTIAQAELMREGDYYVIEAAGGEKRILGIVPGAKPIRVMVHEDDSKPKTCAFGDFWESSSGVLLACVGAGKFDMVDPAGATMSNGQAYPAGSMMLKRR